MGRLIYTLHMSSPVSSQQLYKVYFILPNLHVRKPRLREVNPLVQRCPSSKWQNQNLNPGHLNSKFLPFLSSCVILGKYLTSPCLNFSTCAKKKTKVANPQLLRFKRNNSYEMLSTVILAITIVVFDTSVSQTCLRNHSSPPNKKWQIISVWAAGAVYLSMVLSTSSHAQDSEKFPVKNPVSLFRKLDDI